MNKKYNSILLDIDNTITEIQPTLDLMAEVFNREPITAEEVLEFQLAKAFSISHEEERKFWKEYEVELSLKSKLAHKRVKQMLDTYTDEDTVIFVVTMRPELAYEATFKWLRENNIRFDTLVCLGKQSKLEYALHFGIEAIFEDNAEVFYEVEKMGLEDNFDLYVVDYPYNKEVKNAVRLNRETGKPM